MMMINLITLYEAEEPVKAFCQIGSSARQSLLEGLGSAIAYLTEPTEPFNPDYIIMPSMLITLRREALWRCRRSMQKVVTYRTKLRKKILQSSNH
jgi:hypothetical protein